MQRAQSRSRAALVDLLGELVGVRVFCLETVKLGPQSLSARAFLVGEIHGLSIEST